MANAQLAKPSGETVAGRTPDRPAPAISTFRSISKVAELQLGRLASLLAEEEKTIDSLIQSGEEERAALVNKELPSIAEATAAKNRTLARLGKIEGQRAKCLETLTREWGLDDPGLTLRELIESIEPGWAARLANQRERILKRVEVLSEIDRINRDLLEAAIELVEDCVSFVGSFQRSDALYGHAGRPGPVVRPGASILDTTA